MPIICECGLNVDAPARRAACPECGRACCPSCAIHVDATAYCRWCATAFLAV